MTNPAFVTKTLKIEMGKSAATAIILISLFAAIVAIVWVISHYSAAYYEACGEELNQIEIMRQTWKAPE